MSLKVFVDTSAWLAYFDGDDQYHSRALRVMAQLSGAGAHLVTTDYVFDEALTIVRYRVSHSAAVEFGQAVLSSSVAAIVPIDRRMRGKAWKWFCEYTDKELSFTDCTSFVLMREQGIAKCFGFDRHFVQCGFQLC